MTLTSQTNTPQLGAPTTPRRQLGNLVELITKEADLTMCLLKLGHIVRVWLQLPQHALFFYKEAKEIGISEMEKMRQK